MRGPFAAGAIYATMTPMGGISALLIASGAAVGSGEAIASGAVATMAAAGLTTASILVGVIGGLLAGGPFA